MSMEIVFDDQAISDLEGIFNWIAQVVYQVDEAHRRVVIAAVFHGAQGRDVWAMSAEAVLYAWSGPVPRDSLPSLCGKKA
ncbi:hypothetical protein [Bradyrhizobium sp. AZCC 2230]|uniref:hypothetical protein n=1 Tax=Bradyrhizobium sp. AZCC 2230 TaxID=3117021 RepID=UPI002FF3B954